MQPRVPTVKRIVLVGGGHTHVHVLKSFGMQPEAGVALTLIAKELEAPYSGMLPGYVAGHYTYDECHIDLVRLAHFADARVIHGEVVGIDRQAKRVHIKGRPPLAYDLLSLDTGITPSIGEIAGAAEHAIAVKPVSTFAPRWQALEKRALTPGGPRRIAIVGTGAAGFELILAIRCRLLDQAAGHGIAPDAFRFMLVGSGTLLSTHNARARALARRALAEQGIALIEGDAVARIEQAKLTMASGRAIGADATLVTTKATAPGWFAETGLTLVGGGAGGGFLAVRPTLQAMDDDDIFAVGDCATVLDHAREKAGVFAVRQGPPLTENLRMRARGQAPKPFRPQSRFLTLLSLGHKSAIASRGAFAASGAWAWTWKDTIDRAFMDRFSKLPEMAPGAAGSDGGMYCAGCAAKVGPATLAKALSRLGPQSPSIRIKDLAPGEDAAVLDLGGGDLRLETVDFFRALWPEPYVMGEIAAAHALSDIVAKGGTPDHALAIAEVARAAPHLQEDDLFQLMSGARAVLEREGVAIVGGHSSQGEELAAGFFFSGAVARDQLLGKGGARVGDRLILTKPLGTGILFAGWMRRRARGSDIAAALAGMRRSNTDAARILMQHGATAVTDVTGFGLAGHLLEMLDREFLAATIDGRSCPLYPGVAELARAGIASSLLPENLSAIDRVGGPKSVPGPADRAILFDPQTSGGLLAALSPDRADACLAALAAAGQPAAFIGEIVHRRAPDGDTITLTSSFD